MRKFGYAVAAVALMVAATATNAVASVVPTVPEINPASVTAGLGLLAGGVLILRARRRK